MAPLDICVPRQDDPDTERTIRIHKLMSELRSAPGMALINLALEFGQS